VVAAASVNLVHLSLVVAQALSLQVCLPADRRLAQAANSASKQRQKTALARTSSEIQK
jgi:hypothetical protein